MASIQQIAQNLLATLQGDTKSIKRAQQNLLLYSRDPSFISALLSIPQMQGTTQILNRAATIYTLTYARTLVQARNQSNINMAAQQILSFMSQNNIQFKYRDQVSAALEYLINKDTNNIIISAYVPNTLQMIKNTLQTPISQINIQCIVLISQVMVDRVNPSNYRNAEVYVRQSFMVLCYLVKEVLEHGSVFMGTDEVNAQKVLFLAMKMLRILKKYIKKFMYYDASLVQVLYSQHYTKMINTVLSYNLPQNTLSLPIFYMRTVNQSHKIIQYFHSIKSMTIYILAQSMRILVNTKYSAYNTSIQSQILSQCPLHMVVLVKAIDQLLQKVPYYKLNSKLQLKIIQQIYNYLLVCLRTCRYYQQLCQLKPIIIFSIIFKTLAFCPQDYTTYYDNPSQYVHALLQIIQLDTGMMNSNTVPQMNQSQVELQVYNTIKTNAANLLKVYVKYIDGTLAQLELYIINILDDKINLEISKNLIYLITCILRDEIKTRGACIYELKRIIYKNITELPLPTSNIQQPYNIQYTLNLLVLTRYLLIFQEMLDQPIIDKTYHIIERLLKEERLELAARIIASDLVYVFLKTEEGILYCRRIIQLYNQVLNTKKIQENYLECIVEIISENGREFAEDYLCLIEMVEKVSAFLVFLIKKRDRGNNDREKDSGSGNKGKGKEVEKDKQRGSRIIDKLWNIIQQIVQNKQLIQSMADSVRRILQPLLTMIDGTNELQLQQRLYTILQKIIKSTAFVGQFQLQIFTILPKIFYIAPRKYRLQTPYSLLQCLIFYGKQLLSTDLILTRSLILLCLQNISHTTVNQQPRPQSDCLQGILIIQSLILSVGVQIFNQQIWITITRTLTKKLLQINIIYDLIKGSIVATLSIVLSVAHKYFRQEDNEQLIKIILKQSHNLNNTWLCKMYIIAMSNLLQNYGLGFICGRFNHVLDVTITLLKLAPELKVLRDDDKELDEEKRQFAKLRKVTINCLDGVDEYEYFRNALYAIKEGNSMILENAYEEFPQVKKGYLRDIMSTKKVNSEVRVIYKLKNRGPN